MVMGPHFYLHFVNSLLHRTQSCAEIDVEGVHVPQPPRLHLSAEKLDSHGAFLMDAGDHMMMYIGHNISSQFCSAVLGVPSFSAIPEEMVRWLISYAQVGIFGMLGSWDVDYPCLYKYWESLCIS
jgi:hypothetical protein